MPMFTKAVALFGRPDVLQKFHGWTTIVWLLISTPVALSPLAEQVKFVTWLSLYAIVTGHWSAWQAARVEVKQDEELEATIRKVLREELAAHNE